MNKKQFEEFVQSVFDVVPDFPWDDSPDAEVFRHRDNKKWFALVMSVSRRKLGEDDDTVIDVVNLKCENLLIGSLVLENGIYNAYHMNKKYWITVALDGSVSSDQIEFLTNMSYELTKSTKRGRK